MVNVNVIPFRQSKGRDIDFIRVMESIVMIKLCGGEYVFMQSVERGGESMILDMEGVHESLLLEFGVISQNEYNDIKAERFTRNQAIIEERERKLMADLIKRYQDKPITATNIEGAV